jgi:hypothetical protein
MLHYFPDRIPSFHVDWPNDQLESIFEPSLVHFSMLISQRNKLASRVSFTSASSIYSRYMELELVFPTAIADSIHNLGVYFH